MPEVINFSENMYVYEYIEGDVLSKKITKNIFEDLQNVLNTNFGILKTLMIRKMVQFNSAICSEFYKDKDFMKE